jgi:hypothetical protein
MNFPLFFFLFPFTRAKLRPRFFLKTGNVVLAAAGMNSRRGPEPFAVTGSASFPNQ